ncbi:glutamate receptor 1-like [Onthophagus taurus]|uniref:glutamate receptor 1-like n=1 Tax=Onthophagus taurus TaxID=166361 RepID=UPI0039BDD551
MNELTVLLNTLLLSYFNNTQCVFLVIDQETGIENNWINFNHSCQGFIIFSDHPVDVFDNIERNMYIDRESPYKFNKKKYIFLLNQEEDLHLFNKSKYLNHVPNVLFLTKKESYKKLNFDTFISSEINFTIFTHSYFGNEHEIISLDTWSSTQNKFLFGRNLFFDKTTDLQGKIITLGAFTYNPYVIIGSNYSNSYGIDIRLTQEFMKKHNATPKLIIDKSEKWGMQYNDESKPTDLLAKLYYGNVDIVLGGYIYMRHSYNYLDFTKSHYSSRLTALVPKARLLSEIPLPIYPFSWIVWLLVLISFITISLILSILVYINEHKYLFGDITMKIYGIFIQQSNYLPKIMEGYKKIVIWTFILGIYLSSIYSSRMSSLLIIPRYEKSISTLQDLIKSDIKIGCFAVLDYLLLIVNSDLETDQKVLSHFVEYNWSEIVEFTDDGAIGALTEKTQSRNFAINAVSKKGLSLLEIMSDYICVYQLLLCTKKNFALLDAMNKFISRVIESGLTNFWENEAIYQHSNITMQNIIRYSTNRERILRKLDLEQVAGAFIVLFAGIFLSSLVFIYELALNKYNKSN